jgi:hypothetical protein
MREMPINFPYMGRSMSISQAARHWRTDIRTIRRWADEHGDGLHEAMRQNGIAACRASGKKRGRVNSTTVRPVAETVRLDAAAMQFLQRTMRWVCYSSRIHGETKDVRYHVGNRKLDFAGLIALAESYGFSCADS